jgi:type 1 fimbria pilin
MVMKKVLLWGSWVWVSNLLILTMLILINSELTFAAPKTVETTLEIKATMTYPTCRIGNESINQSVLLALFDNAAYANNNCYQQYLVGFVIRITHCGSGRIGFGLLFDSDNEPDPDSPDLFKNTATSDASVGYAIKIKQQSDDGKYHQIHAQNPNAVFIHKNFDAYENHYIYLRAAIFATNTNKPRQPGLVKATVKYHVVYD